MSTSVPQGHNWTRPVKKDDDEEDPLDQLITRSGCAASHFAVQECMAQHQDWRQCQPQVQAFRDCMSAQQARRREELQRRKEQASAQHWDLIPSHTVGLTKSAPRETWEEETLSNRSGVKSGDSLRDRIDSQTPWGCTRRSPWADLWSDHTYPPHSCSTNICVYNHTPSTLPLSDCVPSTL